MGILNVGIPESGSQAKQDQDMRQRKEISEEFKKRAFWIQDNVKMFAKFFDTGQRPRDTLVNLMAEQLSMLFYEMGRNEAQEK